MSQAIHSTMFPKLKHLRMKLDMKGMSNLALKSWKMENLVSFIDNVVANSEYEIVQR